MLKADIGIVGLAVMGENLALNMESKGFRVAVYNRTTQRVDRFVAGRGKGRNFIPSHSYQELVDHLRPPRKILLMIKAGQPVDETMNQLAPLLSPGDILMDGGNANYQDTARRYQWAKAQGLLFLGVGISGGEEGALTGPSIMPGVTGRPGRPSSPSCKAWPPRWRAAPAATGWGGRRRPLCENGA